MTVTDVNVVLAFLVVCGLSGALAGWVSPIAMHWLAARLYARACALEASRRAYRETHKLATRLGVVAGPEAE